MASVRARRTQREATGDRNAEVRNVGIGNARSRRFPGNWIAAAALAAILAAIFFVQVLWLPKPLSAEEARIRGFSEERALTHLKVLTSYGPKPVGSENLDHAMEYVLGVVNDIKSKADPNVYMEIENFRSKPGANRLEGGLFHGRTLVHANLNHVLVRLSSQFAPDADDNAILVSSHVDTVYTSEGGGDCGSCVSVMLELVRALSHVAQTFRHSVIFLFNTGEEDGLDGAHSFVTQHPWNSSVRLAIDLEAMGAGGKSSIFQAPDNWILEVFAMVAKYPSAQIVAQDIFHSGLIKSATDFQVYRELAGWSGLDFAYIENGAVYHTRNDVLKLVRPGSLQHLGDNMLPLLREVACSLELPSIKTSNYTDKPKAVYFDILGQYMVVYSQEFARTFYTSILVQALVLFGGSFIRADRSAIGASVYGALGILITWTSSLACATGIAILVSYLSSSSLGYVAYPVISVGLFGFSALFGAILGYSAGYYLLHRHLVQSGVISPDIEAERTMFKSGILQWILLLALGTWVGAGSSYIALAWLVVPAIAYGVIEFKAGNRRARKLSLWTLLLAIPIPASLSAGPFISLPSSLIGNLVRIQGNPGALPVWLGNVMIALMLSGIVCLCTTYFLPYIYRGGARWMLLLAASITIISLVVVSFEVLPAFTKDVGKGTYVVQVFEDGKTASESYVSVSFATPGGFTNEIRPLLENGFSCGSTDGPDFVTFKVQKGCTKAAEADEKLWGERPMFTIESDDVVNDRRTTIVTLETKSSLRWVMSVDTNKIESLSMDAISGQEGSLIPKGRIFGTRGQHVIQFVSGRNGPNKFRMQLVWQSGLILQPNETSTLIKLRTDLRTVTRDVSRTLSLLPEWCVLFGKSTSPYNLAYVSKLELK